MVRSVIFLLRVSIFAGCVGTQAMAAERSPLLTRVVGEVELLKPVAKSELLRKENRGRVVKFSGQFYVVSNAKRGLQVKYGSILKTKTNGRAKLIFPNGDQVKISPSSTYKLALREGGATFELFSGKVRSIIKKGGPRANLQMVTKTMIMGVRGTDFFVDAWSAGGSRVSVLRGKVRASSRPARGKKGIQQKPVEVKAGFSSAINADAPKNQKPSPALEPLTKSNLVEIEKSSFVPKAKPSNDSQNPLEKQLAKLERQATVVVLEDIGAEDPALLKKIIGNKKISEFVNSEKSEQLENVNQMTVRKLFRTAPASKDKSSKPSLKDFDALDDDSWRDSRWK